MKKSLFTTIVFAAVAVPALAQSPQDHQQHHPVGSSSAQVPALPAQPTTPPATSPAQPQMPMGGMMQGMGGMMHGSPGQGAGGGQAGMMMNCPMMRGGMTGAAGMGAMSATAAQQRGDQSVASLALRAVNDKMHRDMALELTGNVDADFAKAMIAHHQGAIDMAKIALAFGKDPEIRKLAEEVVRAQESEISFMHGWLAKQPK